MSEAPHSSTVRAMRAFDERFGGEPPVVASAPGRVNLIGDHIDYSGGHVLPLAIDRRCVAAIGPGRVPGRGRLFAADLGEGWEFEPGPTTPDIVRRGSWMSYVVGVLAGVNHGVLPHVDLAIASDVPVGSGLSSSASLEVSVAFAAGRLLGRPADPMGTILTCQRAEHEYAGVPCGVMDQSAAVLGRAGHAILLDCRDVSRHRLVRVPDDAALLVIDTRVRHALADGAYAARRSASERAARALGVELLCLATPEAVARAPLDEEAARCATHAVHENLRVLSAAEALGRGDLAALGRLMFESHASLRDLYRVSCEELDAVVDAAGAVQGAFGARMTGGGFGGCAIVLASPSAVGRVTRAVESAFEAKFAAKPSVMRVSAGSGAMVHPTH